METLGNYEDLEFSDMQKAFVNTAMESYKSQISKYPRNEGTMGLLQAVDEMNKDVFSNQKEQPKCSRGCAHCCYIQVGTSGREVDLIVDYMKKENIFMDNEKILRLEEQALIKNDRDYVLSPHRKCVFLKDNNDCGIYPVRPFACRNYFVFSDPEGCNTFTAEPGGKTLVHFDLNTFPIILTLMETSESDTLPRLLLKKLKENA